MKDCPVCHAKAFDDAEICYGCLHRYAEDGGYSDDTAASETFVADKVACFTRATESCALASGVPPAFVIRFTPESNDSGAVVWSCAVEVA